MKEVKKIEHFQELHQQVVSLMGDLVRSFMKVERDLPSLTDASKHETDPEHVFSLTIVALSIEERLQLKLDRGLLCQYAVVHDLVEAYAGDVSASADEHLHKAKIVNEAEAMKIIQKKYSRTFPWIVTVSKDYDAKIDPESRFIYAVDKLMGAYTWLACDLENWQQYYQKDQLKKLDKTVERLRNKIIRYNPSLLPLFESLHEILYQTVQEKELT